MSLAPEFTPTPAPSASPAAPVALRLPASAIQSAPFVTSDQFPWPHGSTVVYRTFAGRQSWFEVLDVLTGNSTIVDGSKPDARMIIEYDGASITWLATHDHPTADDVGAPSGTRHVEYWAIERYDFATGRLQVIHRSYNHWIYDDPSTHWPYVALDGDLIAYDIETPGPSMNAQIIVQAISTGQVVRTIDVGGPVWDIELRNGDVTYLTGDEPDGEWSTSPDNPRLMFSPAEGATQQLVYQGGFQPEPFEENGVTVSEVFKGFDEYGGTDGHSVLTFDTGRDSTAIDIAGNRQIAHGDGLVVWWSDALQPSGQPMGKMVSVYDTSTHLSALLDQDVQNSDAIYFGLGAGDGWLVWTTQDVNAAYDNGYSLTAHAVRTSDVHTAFEALADGQ